MGMIISTQENPWQAPNNNPTTAYSNNKIAKAAPGVLYGLSGYNSGPAQFLQLHDSATLPADASVPVAMIAIPAASNFSMDFGVYGMGFIKGIAICNSTTGPVKTLGAADCWLSPRYE